MPRVKRVRKRRRRGPTEGELDYLRGGPFYGEAIRGRPFGHPSRDFDHERYRELWAEHGESLTREWVTSRPGSRPFAWWKLECPGRLAEGESQLAFLERHGLIDDAERTALTEHRERELRHALCDEINPALPESELRQAWSRLRSDLIRWYIGECGPGMRPCAFWRFEGAELPDAEAQPETLRRLGLLRKSEREPVERMISDPLAYYLELAAGTPDEARLLSLERFCLPVDGLSDADLQRAFNDAGQQERGCETWPCVQYVGGLRAVLADELLKREVGDRQQAQQAVHDARCLDVPVSVCTATRRRKNS